MIKEINLFAEHGVSEKQYLIWAWQRFRSQAFWSGIVIGLIFMSPLLWAAYSAYLEGDLQNFWGMLIGAIFVGLLFLMGAYWAKSTAIDYPFDPAYTPKGFEMLDVLRRTDPKYVTRLKPRHWAAVQRIDVAAVERAEAAKRPGPRKGITQEVIARRLSLKLMFKKWGIISSVAFSMALITLPFYLDLIKDHAFLSGFVKILLGVLFLLAVVGMHGWLFLYGYLGYLERKIKLQAEYSWDDSIHHGKAATVFGIGFMGLAIVSFGFFMIIPIGLLMGWK